MPADPNLAYLTAAALTDAYRRKEVSPVQATEAALAQIDRHNAAVNAFCLIDAESALAQARESEARYQRGEPAGPLDGVPMGMKDIFLTRGWPTRRGSALVDANQDWADDAPVTAALRAGGAVFLGKTTTPELAWKGVTDSPSGGVTTNPWRTDRTAGGSSGGTAAAVALGMGPVGPGTDGGGSIRIPCAFCGLVGLKPTFAQVPMWPVSPFGSLAHAGPMARTVTDAALLLDVIAQPDVRDWTSLPAPAEPFAARLTGGLNGLRVAYCPDWGGGRVDPEVGRLVDVAAGRFVELGAEVEHCDGPPDPLETFRVLWSAGAAQATSGWTTPEQRARMDPGLVAVSDAGGRYSAVDYVAASVARGQYAISVGRLFERYDLLLTPTLPIAAFAGGRESPAGWHDERWWSWAHFVYPFNLTQQPAASVPCGFTQDGLPVGLQIAGPKHADDRVLRAAYAYQEMDPHHDRRPPIETGAA